MAATLAVWRRQFGSGGAVMFALTPKSAPKPAPKPGLKPWKQAIALTDTRQVDVLFRPNPQAKRFILRIDRKTGQPVVTLPKRASKKDAVAFAQKYSGWLKDHITQVPPRPLVYGSSVPWRGSALELVSTTTSRSVAIQGDTLLVPASRDLKQAVLGFYKSQAKRDMVPRIEKYVQRLSLHRQGDWHVAKVRITDTITRWGSCSSAKVISVNKRLMMAPDWIRDYVCAHEVAHLAQPDHSAAFWQLCVNLEPSIDPKQARAFLAEHGGDYFRVGGQ